MKLKMLFIVVLGWVLTTVCFSETMLKPKFLFEFGKAGLGDGEFGGAADDYCPPDGPWDVAVDFDQQIYVLDVSHVDARVQVFGSNGVFVAKFGSIGPAPDQFTRPYALAVGRLGNIYVTDEEENCVHVFSKQFQYLNRFGKTGQGAGELDCPGQIAIGEANNVYVVDRHNERVAKFDSVGIFMTNFSIPGWDLEGIAMHNDGFYVSGVSDETRAIKSFDFLGNPLGEVLRSKDKGFIDIAEYQGGYVMGSSFMEDDSIHIYTPTNYLAQFGSTGKAIGQFQNPQGLATNPNGRDKLYVSDRYNQRIQVFAFETLTNFSLIPPGGKYSSGDFNGDGSQDIIVYRKGKKRITEIGHRKVAKAALLQIKDNAVSQTRDVALPRDWHQTLPNVVAKPLVGNSLGVYSSIVFKHGKEFRLTSYWVDDALLANEVQETKTLPVPFKVGHIRASGDVNKDGILDIVLIKKQSVKVLLGPDYTELKDITGLPARLPGRVRAMYHEGAQDSVLVFQKGKQAGQGYLIDSNFVASVSAPIAVQGRIRAMSGATPVTQKKRTIKMGGFTHQDPEPKNKRKLQVVGPR